MPIQIQNRQRRVAIRSASVKKRLHQMMQYLGCAEQELSVVFGNDRMLQGLNRIYRQKDRPTNVLAFPQASPVGRAEGGLLGDIVVSLPIATQEAAALQQSLEERVGYLLLHGLLHLLGHDHEAPRQRRRMEALEQQILAQFPA